MWWASRAKSNRTTVHLACLSPYRRSRRQLPTTFFLCARRRCVHLGGANVTQPAACPASSITATAVHTAAGRDAADVEADAERGVTFDQSVFMPRSTGRPRVAAGPPPEHQQVAFSHVRGDRKVSGDGLAIGGERGAGCCCGGGSWAPGPPPLTAEHRFQHGATTVPSDLIADRQAHLGHHPGDRRQHDPSSPCPTPASP